MAARGRENADDALLLALAQGQTVGKAAKAAGVAERTVHRRLELPDFRRRLSELRTRLMSEAVGILAAASSEASLTLRKLLKSKSDTVKLAAARTILEQVIRTREAADLSERFDRLEELASTHRP